MAQVKATGTALTNLRQKRANSVTSMPTMCPFRFFPPLYNVHESFPTEVMHQHLVHNLNFSEGTI